METYLPRGEDSPPDLTILADPENIHGVAEGSLPSELCLTNPQPVLCDLKGYDGATAAIPLTELYERTIT